MVLLGWVWNEGNMAASDNYRNWHTNTVIIYTEIGSGIRHMGGHGLDVTGYDKGMEGGKQGWLCVHKDLEEGWE